MHRVRGVLRGLSQGILMENTTTLRTSKRQNKPPPGEMPDRGKNAIITRNQAARRNIFSSQGQKISTPTASNATAPES